jgi:hypothetical protein
MPLSDVLGHVRPDKMCRNEVACDIDSWMAYGVNVMENLMLKLSESGWPERTQKRKLW